MCCSGVLFGIVEVPPPEPVAALLAHGLVVLPGEGRPFFKQPCPAWVGRKCTIYADRPSRCRSYFCSNIYRVSVGELTAAQAKAKIEQALVQVSELEGMLTDSDAAGTDAARPLRERCHSELERLGALNDDPGAAAAAFELMMGVDRLESMLAADFRMPSPARVP